jgi:lipid II:glycine glycyltransferase (peptidoglycan interpeptide bridge formation enzyme)
MNHFLQSNYWKEVKKKLGNEVYSTNDFWMQTTRIPFIAKFIGYIPRLDISQKNSASNTLIEDIYKLGKKSNSVYVSVDPSNIKSDEFKNIYKDSRVKPGEPTQMQGNIILDLSLPDDELLGNMKPKHRYNIKVAQKKGVEIEIDSKVASLNELLRLHDETVKRQKYKDRSSNYIRTVWETINSIEYSTGFDEYEAKTFIASAIFEGKVLSSWFLICYGDTIYYPYGGSSEENKNVMATYLLVWEIMKWGKLNGYKNFDLMGVAKDKSDGYSRFKSGFGGMEIEYANSFDVVINPILYKIFKLVI